MDFTKIRPNGIYTLKTDKKGKKGKHVEEKNNMREYAKKATKSVKKAAPKALCNHVDSVTGKAALKRVDDTSMKCLLCGRTIYMDNEVLNEDALNRAAELVNSVFGLMRMNGLSGKAKGQIEQELIIAEKWNIAATKLFHKYVSPSIAYMQADKKKNKKKKNKKKNKKGSKDVFRMF